MTACTRFLVMSWLTSSNERPRGSSSESSARPTVVFTSRRFSFSAPSADLIHSTMRTRTEACSSASRVSWAR